MERLDIYGIIKNEPNRITHVKLEKYAYREFAESAYRVKVDGSDTKYCYCAICKSYFSADKNHTVGNIRSHYNSHHSTRKRNLQNTTFNFQKALGIIIFYNLEYIYFPSFSYEKNDKNLVFNN